MDMMLLQGQSIEIKLQSDLGMPTVITLDDHPARYMWQDVTSVKDFIKKLPDEVHCLFMSYSGNSGCNVLLMPCHQTPTASTTSLLCGKF